MATKKVVGKKATATKQAVSKGTPPKGKKSAKSDKATTEPVFPYTNKPGSLRRFLEEIPKRPKPAKFNRDSLRSWGFNDSNDLSILRVLRTIKLLNTDNEPSDVYTAFMNINGGAAALAKPMREVYAQLFVAHHTPYKEGNDVLKNLFNIHSGGSESTLELQIQTFKALAEHTSFDEVPRIGNPGPGKEAILEKQKTSEGGGLQTPIHINLHIHLPENKLRRDYEAIIEDIGRYIFGRTQTGEPSDG